MWGTRKSELGNEVFREVVTAVGKMASGFSVKGVAQMNSNKGVSFW